MNGTFIFHLVDHAIWKNIYVSTYILQRSFYVDHILASNLVNLTYPQWGFKIILSICIFFNITTCPYSTLCFDFICKILPKASYITYSLRPIYLVFYSQIIPSDQVLTVENH